MPRIIKSQRPAADLEEIGPGRFLIREPGVIAVLKGEGEISGRTFVLTSWRREGLLARLRQRSFRVRTLADRIAALPAPPRPPAIGQRGWRTLHNSIEQISYFDPRDLCWRPVADEERGGERGVFLRAGWVVRRRKGRGHATYCLALITRGERIEFKALDEEKALLLGYAQALALDDRPLVVEKRGKDLLLPDADLPPSYREVLQVFATKTNEGFVVDQRNWPLAQELFAHLGVRLAVE